MVYLTEAQGLDEIRAFLAAGRPEARVERDEEEPELHVTFGDWRVRVVDFAESWVGQEAAELATRCGDDAQKRLLARSKRRLEIYPAEDPDDTHFNDWLLVYEALAALPGAVGFDPTSGEFA
jgi:hypothetical protein